MNSRRRLLLALAAGAFAGPPALAQQQNRMRRIGFLSGANASTMSDNLAAFRMGMAELGWSDRRDYVIDERYSDANAKVVPGLLAELLATQPDLLLLPGNEVVRLFLNQTRTLPIVFAIAQDPVGAGLVASLQRPGGNATGLASLSNDLAAKRLQLLKEALPRIAHVAVLFPGDEFGSLPEVKAIEEAGARLKIRVTRGALRQRSDIEAAFKRGASLGAQAYLMVQGGFMGANDAAIVELATRLRVPSVSYRAGSVQAGALMSYAASNPDNFRRAAGYVDKILKGAKPGELPIEQPVKFEMVINMRTAKAMGLTIPQSILLRADRVIE